MVRYSLISLNAIVVVGVLTFLLVPWGGSSGDTSSSLAIAPNGEASASPLDTLSSSEIAATTAQLAGVQEVTALINQADSDQAQLKMVASNQTLISKPQVVASDYLSNKDIKTYVVKKDDTLASIAHKFGLSENTLRWSNDLPSYKVKTGQKLSIPPANGIIYKVQKGDTAASLATKFGASKNKIIAYNDAELKGLKVGERIIVPGGEKPQPKPQPQPTYYDYGSGFAWGASPVYGHNGYDYGYCTWYVATQINMPANWGNAVTWAYYASMTPGWNVSSAPTVGSIAQRGGGAGHVAIVEAVKGNMIKVSDMNGIAGWGRVGTGWQPISSYQHFISR